MTSLNENDVMFIERFLNAFKTLGGNELGFIDYAKFKNSLMQKSDHEIKGILDLINEEQHIHDGKLDYISLCFSILSVKTIFNSLSSENGKVVPASPRINSRTFTRNKGSNIVKTQQKDTNPSTTEIPFIKSIKGMLFNIFGNKLGHRYQLELLETSVVEIYAKAVTHNDQNNKMPIEILIFQDNKKKIFTTCSSVINDEGYCSVKFNLKKGKYILIPVLLQWDHNVNGIPQTGDMDFLMFTDEESNKNFTAAGEKALKLVYDAIDLDGNGLLNQQEFDLFICHTSGETAAEEWTTIEDNFKMKHGQLTFEGFLELYRLVLQTDPPDMLNMFQQIGMNEKFELKNAQQFVLVAKSETGKFNLNPLTVSPFMEVCEKVFKKIAVEQGSSSKIKNMNDLYLFKHHLPHRITFVIQNQSHSKMTIRLDCSDSINCKSHRESLDYSLEVLPRTSMIGHHLFPVDTTKDWNVECKESFK